MDDAALQTALGIHGLNSLHHPAQTIGTEQIYTQNTPAFEVVQHIQPEFAAFMLADPHAQNVLVPVHGDSQHHTGHIAVILFDLVVNGIHEHEGIDRFQRTVLLSVDLRHDLPTDLAHQLRRDLHIVQTLDLLRNVPLAHAAGVKG